MHDVFCCRQLVDCEYVLSAFINYCKILYKICMLFKLVHTGNVSPFILWGAYKTKTAFL